MVQVSFEEMTFLDTAKKVQAVFGLVVALFHTSCLAGDFETVIYSEFKNTKLRLDIHLPLRSASTAEELYPMVVWIHGGGWRNGSRLNWKLVDWLPTAGYAVVSIDYRLTDTAIFPAQIVDCKEALKWIATHGRAHGLDPDRIAVSGLSAGAQLASLLGVSNFAGLPRIRGVVHFYGPSDFLAMARYARKDDDVLNAPASPVFGLLGGPLRDRLPLAKLASPVNFLDKYDPPMLILVGNKDSLMIQRQCRLLHDKAKEREVPVSLHVIEGAGHGGPKFSDEVRRGLITNFLEPLLAK